MRITLKQVFVTVLATCSLFSCKTDGHVLVPPVHVTVELTESSNSSEDGWVGYVEVTEYGSNHDASFSVTGVTVLWSSGFEDGKHPGHPHKKDVKPKDPFTLGYLPGSGEELITVMVTGLKNSKVWHKRTSLRVLRPGPFS